MHCGAQTANVLAQHAERIVEQDLARLMWQRWPSLRERATILGRFLPQTPTLGRPFWSAAFPRKGATMHVVTRRYSGPGAKELIDLVLRHKDEIEKLMRGVPGFVSYIIARTDQEWFTGTICVDKAGCDASVKIAREWIAKHVASTGGMTPQITEGEILLRVTA
jgi:hypothetical protein